MRLVKERKPCLSHFLVCFPSQNSPHLSTMSEATSKYAKQFLIRQDESSNDEMILQEEVAEEEAK